MNKIGQNMPLKFRPPYFRWQSVHKKNCSVYWAGQTTGNVHFGHWIWNVNSRKNLNPFQSFKILWLLHLPWGLHIQILHFSPQIIHKLRTILAIKRDYFPRHNKESFLFLGYAIVWIGIQLQMFWWNLLPLWSGSKGFLRQNHILDDLHLQL